MQTVYSDYQPFLAHRRLFSRSLIARADVVLIATRDRILQKPARGLTHIHIGFLDFTCADLGRGDDAILNLGDTDSGVIYFGAGNGRVVDLRGTDSALGNLCPYNRLSMLHISNSFISPSASEKS